MEIKACEKCDYTNNKTVCNHCLLTKIEKEDLPNYGNPRKLKLVEKMINRCAKKLEQLTSGDYTSNYKALAENLNKYSQKMNELEEMKEFFETLVNHSGKEKQWCKDEYFKNGMTQKLLKRMFYLDDDENFRRLVVTGRLQLGSIAGSHREDFTYITIFGDIYRKQDLLALYKWNNPCERSTSKYTYVENEEEFKVIDLSPFKPTPSGILNKNLMSRFHF